MKKILVLEALWFIGSLLLAIPLSLIVELFLKSINTEFYNNVHEEWSVLDSTHANLNNLDLFDNVFLGFLCFMGIYIARFIYSSVVEFAISN